MCSMCVDLHYGGAQKSHKTHVMCRLKAFMYSYTSLLHGPIMHCLLLKYQLLAAISFIEQFVPVYLRGRFHFGKTLHD